MTTSKGTRGLGKIVSNPTGTWTLRYWANGKQCEETFSTKKLAQDRQAKIWHDKRSGEITFTDKAKGAVKFTDYAQIWIDAHQNTGTKNWMNTTLKLHIAPEVGNMTLTQVANDRELAQRLISGATLTYGRKIRMVIVGPLNEAMKAGRINSHRLRGLKVEEGDGAKEFTQATRAQLDRMALAMGERAMVVWLGAYAGLRLGESLGVSISDFIDGGTVLRLQRQREANGSLVPNLKARKAGQFRDVPVSAELS